MQRGPLSISRPTSCHFPITQNFEWTIVIYSHIEWYKRPIFTKQQYYLYIEPRNSEHTRSPHSVTEVPPWQEWTVKYCGVLTFIWRCLWASALWTCSAVCCAERKRAEKSNIPSIICGSSSFSCPRRCLLFYETAPLEKKPRLSL